MLKDRIEAMEYQLRELGKAVKAQPKARAGRAKAKDTSHLE